MKETDSLKLSKEQKATLSGMAAEVIRGDILHGPDVTGCVCGDKHIIPLLPRSPQSAEFPLLLQKDWDHATTWRIFRLRKLRSFISIGDNLGMLHAIVWRIVRLRLAAGVASNPWPWTTSEDLQAIEAWFVHELGFSSYRSAVFAVDFITPTEFPGEFIGLKTPIELPQLASTDVSRLLESVNRGLKQDDCPSHDSGVNIELAKKFQQIRGVILGLSQVIEKDETTHNADNEYGCACLRIAERGYDHETRPRSEMTYRDGRNFYALATRATCGPLQPALERLYAIAPHKHHLPLLHRIIVRRMKAGAATFWIDVEDIEECEREYRRITDMEECEEGTRTVGAMIDGTIE